MHQKLKQKQEVGKEKMGSKETVERLTEEKSGEMENFQKCYFIDVRYLDTEGWKFALLSHCSQQKSMIHQQDNSSSAKQWP